MNLLGPTAWVRLIIQSLTVFSFLTAIGLGLLAVAIFLARVRR
jgi:hypothetical protein